MTTDELTQEEKEWLMEWRRLRDELAALYPAQAPLPTEPPEGTAAMVLPHD